MGNRYRLSSNAFDREKEAEKIEPQKIYFLSVEGNRTEPEYFAGISKYRKCLGIDMRVDVEVLRRSSKDTNSAPKQVLELLEEYIRLREAGCGNLIKDIPDSFMQLYGVDFIQQYLEKPSSIPRQQRNDFVVRLREIGYDINYRKYLSKYNHDMDSFGILIDRDEDTHSKKNMAECICYCCQKGYDCYVSNPCFEFWLLLHLSDVSVEYRTRLKELRENKKVTGMYTFVGKEVSDKAGHGKHNINFKKNYLDHVDEAIARAKKFPMTGNELIDSMGSNIGNLIEALRRYPVKS